MRWTEDQLADYQSRLIKMEVDTHKPDEGPESKLQGKAENWCREHGYPYFHDRSRGKNKAGSILDLYVYLPEGRHIVFEFKDKRGRLSKEQAQTIRMLKHLKHEVHEVRSYRQFLDIVNKEV